ncbi:unnamed protein product [Rangifer tarandus platyrhynchus]|uniref:Uncharacterized protein n=1 Tax=Rangifer tarandus platyrhynchus TaxID=3082113 RepID=A0ABN8XIC7_RANTA|nr:unnamed protein product [Rangifer tarandus platyrhynchus]
MSLTNGIYYDCLVSHRATRRYNICAERDSRRLTRLPANSPRQRLTSPRLNFVKMHYLLPDYYITHSRHKADLQQQTRRSRPLRPPASVTLPSDAHTLIGIRGRRTYPQVRLAYSVTRIIGMLDMVPEYSVIRLIEQSAPRHDLLAGCSDHALTPGQTAEIRENTRRYVCTIGIDCVNLLKADFCADATANQTDRNEAPQ